MYAEVKQALYRHVLVNITLGTSTRELDYALNQINARVYRPREELLEEIASHHVVVVGSRQSGTGSASRRLANCDKLRALLDWWHYPGVNILGLTTNRDAPRAQARPPRQQLRIRLYDFVIRHDFASLAVLSAWLTEHNACVTLRGLDSTERSYWLTERSYWLTEHSAELTRRSASIAHHPLEFNTANTNRSIRFTLDGYSGRGLSELRTCTIATGPGVTSIGPNLGPVRKRQQRVAHMRRFLKTHWKLVDVQNIAIHDGPDRSYGKISCTEWGGLEGTDMGAVNDKGLEVVAVRMTSMSAWNMSGPPRRRP